MKRNFILLTIVILVAAILFGSLFFWVFPHPASATSTTLSILSGKALVFQESTDSWVEVSDGTILRAGERIRTDSNSHALLTFFEGSTMELEPDSEVTIEELTVASDTGSAIVRLKQQMGKTWSRVEKLIDPASRYEVGTPSAAVLVRGTLLGIEVDADGATLASVFEGQARVIAQEQEVLLTANYETTVKPGEAPTVPSLVPPSLSKLQFSLHSACWMLVVDPAGRSAGIVPPGVGVNQIPGAVGSSTGEDPQTLELSEPVMGEYTIVLYGRLEGSFSLQVKGVAQGETVFSLSAEGNVTPERKYQAKLSVETEAGAVSGGSLSNVELLMEQEPGKVVIVDKVVEMISAETATPSVSASTPTPTVSPAPTASPELTVSPTPTPTATAVPDVGSISGFVYDQASMTPIAGATVKAWNYEQAGPLVAPAVGEVTTDSSGYYIISGLPPGDYRLSSVAPGKAVEFYHETFGWNEAEPVSAVKGQDIGNIEFTLEPGGTISGKIVDADTGLPIAGASVCATFADGKPGGMITTSDEGGNYILKWLSYGTYVVRAPAPLKLGPGDDNYVTEWWQEKRGQHLADSVTVSEGVNPVAIDFTLEGGGFITGRVMDTAGQGIYNLHIYAEDYYTGEWMGGANTDQQGNYIVSLPPGDYRLRACATCNGSPYVDEWYNNVLVREQADKVTVTEPGQTTGSVDFILEAVSSSPGG